MHSFTETYVKQVTWASLVHQHQLGCRVNLDMPSVEAEVPSAAGISVTALRLVRTGY